MRKHDLAKEPPPRELLERLIPDENPESFLNRRSPAYKQRELHSRPLSKKQVIDLMIAEPNLIRRPLVVSGDEAVFGYSPAEYERIL